MICDEVFDAGDDANETVEDHHYTKHSDIPIDGQYMGLDEEDMERAKKVEEARNARLRAKLLCGSIGGPGVGGL